MTTQELTKQQIIAIAHNIDMDLDNGVYGQYIYQSQQMRKVLKKLQRLQFVINSDPLTNFDLQVLKHNDYIA